jgi:hypothetical protein
MALADMITGKKKRMQITGFGVHPDGLGLSVGVDAVARLK